MESLPKFNFCVPLKKSSTGGDILIGVASTLSLDKDEEKMSSKALQQMEMDIKTLGINLFGNHEHNWENTLGSITGAHIEKDALKIEVRLDDPITNAKIPMLLNKLSRGINLGLSVGGNVTDFKWVYDEELQKKIKMIDAVKLYEVSVVGIPSNGDSFLSIPGQITKSFNERSAKSLNIKNSTNVLIKCPLCFTQKGENKQCPICLY